jgi:hypothetical protein
MTSLGRYLAGSVLIWIGPVCPAQTITIRAVNGKNGYPLPRQNVTISLLYEKGEKAPAKYSAQLNLETDDNGETHFTLPEPPPAHLAASVRIDWSHWRCPCALLDSTQNVLQSGVVKAEPSGKDSGNPKPGEILFVARPLSLFYRLFGWLEKD